MQEQESWRCQHEDAEQGPSRFQNAIPKLPQPGIGAPNPIEDHVNPKRSLGGKVHGDEMHQAAVLSLDCDAHRLNEVCSYYGHPGMLPGTSSSAPVVESLVRRGGDLSRRT